jgi:hypothetical protein
MENLLRAAGPLPVREGGIIPCRPESP